METEALRTNLRGTERGQRDMGMVLSFPPLKRQSTKRIVSGGDASVVIFPGVRYERMSSADLRGAMAKSIDRGLRPNAPAR